MKKANRSFTKEEKALIVEGFNALLKGSTTTFEVDRKKYFAKVDEIKKQLGIKKFKGLVDVHGKLLV